jgi:hypothetical protein
MSNIQEVCLNKGRVVTRGQTQAVIDFIVFDKDLATAIIFIDSWYNSELISGRNLLYVAEGIIQTGEENWEFPESEILIGAFDSDAEKQTFENIRIRMDIHRDDYLKRLKEVKKAYPDFDFEWWLEMTVNRPTRTARQIYTDKWENDRQIGFVMLLSPEGSLVDYLAIDNHGYTHTKNPTGWLSLYAHNWSTFGSDRPILEKFINNLQDKSQPMSLNTVSHTQILTAKGSLLTIANTLANSSLNGELS